MLQVIHFKFLDHGFGLFKIKYDDLITKGPITAIYKAVHAEFLSIPLIVKIYENMAKSAKNPIFLKVLRHLGKKHPFIVPTWDIFHDHSQRVFVFQEFMAKSNLDCFLREYGCPKESQLCEWARSLYKAMDYLGDMGICHRNICPKSVLIHKDFSLRLTNFENAILYWNPQKENIIHMPCISSNLHSHLAKAEFKAPECYGDPATEVFDPILADTWSLGAVVFYTTQMTYPYDFQVRKMSAMSILMSAIVFR